ncbi:hypothetical protein RBA69_08280 [Brenneria goodwinii]
MRSGNNGNIAIRPAGITDIEALIESRSYLLDSNSERAYVSNSPGGQHATGDAYREWLTKFLGNNNSINIRVATMTKYLLAAQRGLLISERLRAIAFMDMWLDTVCCSRAVLAPPWNCKATDRTRYSLVQ